MWCCLCVFDFVMIFEIIWMEGVVLFEMVSLEGCVVMCEECDEVFVVCVFVGDVVVFEGIMCCYNLCFFCVVRVIIGNDVDVEDVL